jgi:hypothetical protein
MTDLNAMPVDLRQTDVAETERIFAAVDRSGSVALPDLIAVDLSALGAAFQSVFDVSVWQAWLRLPDAYRSELATDAFGGLIRRKLMDRAEPTVQSGGTPVARLAPPLALIMMTRAQPAFVVQCAAEGGQRGAPRMYGICEEDLGLRAVLIERASRDRIGFGVSERVTLSPEEDEARAGDLNQLYQYLLLAPGRAVGLLTSWLTDTGPGRTPSLRTIDLYRHREAELITRARLTALGHTDGRFTVTRQFSGADGQASHDLEKDEVASVVSELVIAGTKP